MARDTGRLYFPYVDGLRAVSILAVVLFHLDARLLPGGFAGVDVFFVVSGFIVSASLHGLRPSGFLSLVTLFYSRRFRRIVPALVFMLVTTGLAVAVFVPEAYLSQSIRRTAFSAFFGFSNFRLAAGPGYFDPRAELNPFTHTWSLAVEEQFYLIFPVLIFLLTSRFARVAAAVLFALCVLSFAYGFKEPSTSLPLGFYSSLSRFWEIGSGVLLYAMLARFGLFDSKPVQRRELQLVTYLGSALIAAGFVVGASQSYPVPGALLPVAGALCIIAGLQGRAPQSPIGRLLSTQAAVALGKISYSLYLWHWPVFVLFRWTVGFSTPAQKLAALALAIALSLISYLLVEQPLRVSSRLRTPWRAVVTYLVAVGLFAWISDRTLANAQYLSASVVTAHPEDWISGYKSREVRLGSGCQVDWRTTILERDASLKLSQRVNCDAPEANSRLFVIGDSHATTYSTMLEDYVRLTGIPVSLYQLTGCNFVHLVPPPPLCAKLIEQTVEDTRKQLKAGDVVFLPGLRVPRFRDQWDDDELDPAAAWSRVMQVSDAGLAASLTILDRLSVPGVHIVLELPKPLFPTNLFKCSDWFNRGNPACRAGTELPRAVLEQHRQPVIAFAEKLRARVPGLSTWDPFPVLCPADPCAMLKDGKPLYFDGDHISATANRLLLPDFMRKMTELGVATTAGAPTREGNLR